MAVTGALSMVPWTYANVVMAALVGAAGTLQVASIAAKPIPTFAEGGIMRKDGTALINDGGNMEYVERNGKILTTSAENALVPLKGGDIIHKDFNTMKNNNSLNWGDGAWLSTEGIEDAIERGYGKVKNNIKVTVMNEYNPYREQMQNWN